MCERQHTSWLRCDRCNKRTCVHYSQGCPRIACKRFVCRLCIKADRCSGCSPAFCDVHLPDAVVCRVCRHPHCDDCGNMFCCSDCKRSWCLPCLPGKGPMCSLCEGQVCDVCAKSGRHKYYNVDHLATILKLRRRKGSEVYDIETVCAACLDEDDSTAKCQKTDE